MALGTTTPVRPDDGDARRAYERLGVVPSAMAAVLLLRPHGLLGRKG